MAEAQPVRVAGLTALRKDLKAAEAYEEIALIGQAFGEAGELIRATAQAKANATGRRVDAKLGETYEVTKSKVTASIRMGDKSVPFLLGNEWGAYRTKRRVSSHPSRSWVTRREMVGWLQFPEVTKGGRFLYPAAAEKGPEMLELLADAVERVLTQSSDSEGE